MRDRDIRRALHETVFSAHRGDPDTLVLNELGLRHGECRVDIAVINGMLHGFEIKSDSDTLERLPSQVVVYSAVLDRATLVVGEKHTSKAITKLPSWWGVNVVYDDGFGNPKFECFRAEQPNPGINPVALAELLWRGEAVEVLDLLGAPAAVLRQPRGKLYRYLAEAVETTVLGDIVRRRLKARAGWRCQ